MNKTTFTPKATLLAIVLTAVIMPCGAKRSMAQDCTANAGGNVIVCGTTTILNGGVSGNIGPNNPNWTFVSGPTTPSIVSPSSLTTAVSGMTENGDYVFQLSQACDTGIAQSQVTVTAHPRPASFTAGPDKTGICATTGTTGLGGVIPPGYTGYWTAVNIHNSQEFGTVINTNASFSNDTIANPVFSLINTANHEIDPAYYAILTIISSDGWCTYKDTAIVRFCPNPALNVVNVSGCISSTSSQFFDFTSGPAFSSNTTGAAGAAVNGTTVTLNVTSQPSGGNIAFSRIEGRRIYVTGANIIGSYTFTITVSSCCDTVTSPSMTYTVTGIQNQLVNLQPAGHGAPEQLALYGTGGSGGEVHCGIAGTNTPELFYFSINPADDPATVITTVTSSGILPPGASTPVITHSGAGLANRTVSVDPGVSGWKIGTYRFTINVGTNPCFRTQRYYIHVTDENRPPLFVPDTSVCYPGTGSISSVIRLPDVYQGAINPSYLQDFGGYYNFQVISKPAGAAIPTYTTSNLRLITQTYTTISNLDKPGDYVIRITPFSGNGAGPFLEQEYACSGITGALNYDFTIRLEEKINANAGSDQMGICANTASLLGNATGAGTGEWTVVSAPAGATPNIVASTNPSATATNLTEIGTYLFAWTIRTPWGGCVSSDTVSFEVICQIPLPVGLTYFTATRADGTTLLKWSTEFESNSKGFELERSGDGMNFNGIGFVNSKSEKGYSNVKLAYSYVDKTPLNGINFYRLKETDFDGKYRYSIIRQVTFEDNAVVSVHPNPVKEYVTINGLKGAATLKMYDAMGRTVKTLKTTQKSATISLAELGEGLYNIHILHPDGEVIFKKILKVE